MKRLNKLVIFTIFLFGIGKIVNAQTECGFTVLSFSQPKSGSINNEPICIRTNETPQAAYARNIAGKLSHLCTGIKCQHTIPCPNQTPCPTDSKLTEVNPIVSVVKKVLTGACPGGKGNLYNVTASYKVNFVYCNCLCDECPPTDDQSFNKSSVPDTCSDLVELSSLTAKPTEKGILLNWNTKSELDSQGFKMWRAIPNLTNYCGCSGNIKDYTQIQVLDKEGKPILIPAKGSTTSGFDYSYLDKDAKPGIAYCYALEDIDSKGKSKFYFEYVAFSHNSSSQDN